MYKIFYKIVYSPTSLATLKKYIYFYKKKSHVYKKNFLVNLKMLYLILIMLLVLSGNFSMIQVLVILCVYNFEIVRKYCCIT